MAWQARGLAFGLPAALSAALPAVLGFGSPALAHTSERVFVLTLPSDLYIAGGAIVVAVSFLLVALVPAANLRVVEAVGWSAGRLPDRLARLLSLVTLLVMVVLILAGHFGTQDPLANPLPLMVWTVWWIGLTMAHALFGNLWVAFNPWRGLADLIAAVARPPLRYPAWLGYWPAWLQFLAFAWFELIYTVPQNPEILADAVTLYFLVNLAGCLLFGSAAWLRQGECFAVFFRVVAWLSPFNGRPEGADRGGGIVATLPGFGLLHLRPLPISGVAFVLLALGSLSFEGLAITYWWLDLIGVNPLDFPGRSAVALSNTLGLLSVFAVWMACYLAVVWLGHRLASEPVPLSEALGSYVISIVPIALGYHVAHYLTAFLVDMQYTAITLNDPFGRGWDLFGLAEAYVTTSFLNEYYAVRLIWHLQIAVIVIVHVMAVSVAHTIALRQTGDRGTAVLSQIPMTLLMIGYTMFGLWLLSTAAIG